MAKRKHKKVRTSGEVYLLQIWIGTIIYLKIGYTKRTARCRLIEVGTELLDQLGYFPKIKIVSKTVVSNPQAVEADLLEKTKEYRPTNLPFTFSGYSEIRCMDLNKLEVLYKECINKDYRVTLPDLISM